MDGETFDFYGIGEMASRLGVSRSMVMLLERDGVIPRSRRVGGRGSVPIRIWTLAEIEDGAGRYRRWQRDHPRGHHGRNGKNGSLAIAGVLIGEDA